MNVGIAELPPRIYKKDMRFQKGMFVAANVKIAEDGTALFGQVNSELVMEMQESRRCQLCGQRIAKTDWCVFPGSMRDMKYQEAPLHVECARYSAIVCPNILRKKDTYAFAVCKKYIFVKFEPPYWRDEGCIPQWDHLSSWNRFILTLAHDIQRDEQGKSHCVSCNQENAGMMNYDEFMKWSAM